MEEMKQKPHTYHVDKITFLVTPVYPEEKGETIFSILLKLMKSDADQT
jgi:hypothetical protein